MHTRKMKIQWITVWLVTLLYKTFCAVTTEKSSEMCQDKPADVLFLLDSSASISYTDFRKQLSFVQDVIHTFDMSPRMTRVASLSFSNWAFLDFHLNEYDNKEEVLDAVGKIRQIRGDTNTASALNYMQDEMFKPEVGGREGIPHVAIVLTDGKSNKPADTAVEALRARLRGIHIFAIGVGADVDQSELRAIASQPHDRYVFKVDSYSSLVSIKNLLAIETCKVTDPPTVTLPTIVNQGCASGKPRDVILAVPPTANLENTNRALEFYQDWIASLGGVGDTLHIGMAPKECVTTPFTDQQSFTDKTEVLNHIDRILNTQPSTANTIHYMRVEGFKHDLGSRKNAKKIGILMIEDEESDLQKARREAAKAKIMQGMDIHVIAVGKTMTDVQDLATSPQHVHHVTSYEDLSQLALELTQAVCTGM